MLVYIIILLSFIVIMFTVQAVFFELNRKRAIDTNNYAWFSAMENPFNYTRTTMIVVMCVICYVIGGGDDSSGANWFISLFLFTACGVVADAVSQYLLMHYARIRSKKQIQEWKDLSEELNTIDFSQFKEDTQFEVSLPQYNETLITKNYLKPTDHLAFMSMDQGEYVKSFGTYPESTYDVEPFSDTDTVQINFGDLPVKATKLTEKNQMPFKDDRIDIVMDEYANFDKNEIARILKPGGMFIVNQYGTYHLKEFTDMYMPRGIRGSWDVNNCMNILSELGFTIREHYEDFGYIRFRTIDQLHTYFSKNVPAVAKNVEQFKNFYLKAIKEIDEKGYYQVSTYRFLITAKWK